MNSLRPANDYEMPLFDRYDMSVEFERCMTRVRQALHRNWRDYCKMSDKDIIDQFWDGETTWPLELHEDGVSVAEVQANIYEFAVPYEGEDAFWHLYPVAVLWGVLGEPFRGQLRLPVLARSLRGARVAYEERLAQIREVLALQRMRIEIFDQAQPTLILGELAKIRRSPPEPYLILGQ